MRFPIWQSPLIAIAVILISILPPSSPKYVYDPNKARDWVAPKATDFRPWDGVGPIPSVPGDKDQFDKVVISRTPGADCKDYKDIVPGLLQERGKWKDGNTTRYIYPFKSWVKTCDVARFLWCKNKKCACFPGKYWYPIGSGASADGSCVSSYHQDCSEFKGFTFRLQPECGEGMDCVPNPKAPDSKHCICNAKAIYNASGLNDSMGHPKYFCTESPELDHGDPCFEYEGKAWKKIDNNWELVSVTKTGCGDVGQVGEPNFFCRFPESMLGLLPMDEKGNPTPYGKRTGGNCSCSDESKLGYLKGHGCSPKPGAPCTYDEGLVEFYGRTPGKGEIYLTTAHCGDFAVCYGAKPPDVREKKPAVDGRCICGKNHHGHRIGTNKYKQCDPSRRQGQKEDNSTKQVDEECHSFYDPCPVDEGQKCKDGKCKCKNSYETVTVDGKLVCRGLYGVPCHTVADCAADGGFECVKVPELTKVSPAFDEHTTYCVCEHKYLNTITGKCGKGANLQSIRKKALFFIVLFFKFYRHQ